MSLLFIAFIVVITIVVISMFFMIPSTAATAATASKVVPVATPAAAVQQAVVKAAPPRKFVSAESRTTPAQVYQGSGSYNLSKHDINCNNKAINRMKMSSNDKDMYFDYSCSAGVNLGTPVPTASNLDIAGGGHSIFLDRQNINCGDGKVLTQVKYEKPGEEDKVMYKYQCAPVDGLTCRKASTPTNSGGDGNVRFLDRHDLKCNDDEALSQFLYRRDSPDTFHYDYTCCKV